MSTPILATKLYLPPPRPNLVARPRLLAQLNAGLHRKLTLISAPAGFGKTTLISAWIAALQCDTPPRAVAWLALDERDNDPIRFLTYLVAALQTIAPQIGSGLLPLLQSPQPPREPFGREVLLTTLLNELTTHAAHGLLVLDDYHLIGAAPNGHPSLDAVDQVLTFLLDHLPPQLHIVITTREDPPLPLARYRVRGQLTEVRAADLRFTTAEAADFLNQAMGLTLSAAEIGALESRTEGWIAGLQLAALSMQGRTDTGTFIDAFTGDHHFILDYLVEEVLQHQPAPVRHFLLQTAILDRLTGALCDAVTGQEGGRALLATLEHDNLFVVPLDDKRQWYRYHHLFADVLQARLMAEQPDQLPLLHQRASDWYEQNGLRTDAIRHALAAKDFVRTAALVELAWPALDGRFQSATWLSWARALPAEVVQCRPVLAVAYGWALLNDGMLDAAEAWFALAERWLATTNQSELIVVDAAQFRNLPASIATARAYQTQAQGDIAGSVSYGQRALDLLPADDHLRRGPAAALLALAQWANGDLAAAYQTLATAMTNFQKVGNLHFALSGTYGLGDIRTVQGRLHDAVKIYTQMLQLALAQQPAGTPLLPGTAELYMGLGELAREQGDLNAAQQHLLKSGELGEGAGLPNWHYRFYRILARFKLSQGDLTGALDQLDLAERHFRPSPVPDVQPLAAWRTRVWVAQGRLHDAQRWVQEQGLSVDDEMHFLREFEHITLARVLLAAYQHDRGDRAIGDALHLLPRLQLAAEAGGRMGSFIEILVLQALAHGAQADQGSALVALERALMLAEPEGYVRIFVDEGAPMARLLRIVVGRGVMPEYVNRLLAAFDPVPAGQVDKPTQTPVTPAPLISAVQPLFEPLSQRELEVLHLIAQGLSNHEISEKLFLALSTVKGHNRIIFDKLQVQRRTEAVARARALGLV